MIKYTQISIDELIKRLEEEKNKGGKTLAIDGTLIVKENGNSVVITNKQQW
jgi:hypothetical protein